ncbi:MAG: O-methyltransferase [Planctomycetota bacterium]|nr:O-methyltransferase [Planctomycetota bacterium]
MLIAHSFQEPRMENLRYPNLETYRRTLFSPEDDHLKGIMPAAVEKGVPKISVSAESGKILEIGALAGYSGTWLARSLPADGTFLTLEYEPRHAEIARANYAKAGIQAQAEVRVGKALDLLPGVAGDAPFDLCFIDADKGNYPHYLDYALKYVRKGGLIVADNADAHGNGHKVLDDGNDARGIQVYNERVSADPRLVSVIVPYGGWLAVSLVV